MRKSHQYIDLKYFSMNPKSRNRPDHSETKTRRARAWDTPNESTFCPHQDVEVRPRRATRQRWDVQKPTVSRQESVHAKLPTQVLAANLPSPLGQRSISTMPFFWAARDWQRTMDCCLCDLERTKSRCSTSPEIRPHLHTPQMPSAHLTSIWIP